ncbi:MAG: hypothetical protein AB1728_06435 [Bacteroidota bacterium]
MKKQLTHIFSLCTIALIVLVAGTISSCKKKAELPNVTEWETHQDPINGMEIQYPKGWLLNADPKSVRVYSSQVVADKFYEVYSTGTGEVGEEQGGVEVTISWEKFLDAKVGTLEEYKAATMQNYSALNLANEQPITIGKENGVSYSYKVKVSKNTVMEGKKIIVAHDSVFYTVSVTGFNEYFEVYSPLLDKIVASIKLPRPKERYTDPNAASKPSAEVTKFANDFLEFMYPDNFTVTPVSEKKGGAIHSLHVEGLRKDCTIDISIFATKTDKGEVKFERFFEDNKGKFKPKSTTSGKVDGLDAKVIVASPAPQIDREVYFVAKGEKIYQVILTWYKPMSADFQPAFKNVVASLKLK